MKAISLAIISDLHIGDARGRDMNPPWVYDPQNKERIDPQSLLDESYLETFVRFATDNGLRPDYLIVPGDVSNGGHPAQIVMASEILRKCADALKVPEERIVFVPGNHDVDWSMLREDDTTGHYRGLRYSTFSDADLLFGRVAQRASFSLFDEPYFASWRFDDLLVVGYNSAWDDGPNNSPNHGYIHTRHVKQLDEFLAQNIPDASCLRVFIIHHHPIQYSDPTDLKDFGTIQNAPRLFDLLARHKFDLLVHGHKHLPAVTPHFQGYGNFIAVLCAGSFSAQMFPGWEGQIGNQFHMVEVAGRSSGEGSILGEVRSWTYEMQRGWIQSYEKGGGIRHIEPFGAYVEESSLVVRVHPIVEGMLSRAGFARWSDITKADELLRLISSKQVKMILKRIGNDIGAELMESETEYILFKNDKGASHEK